MTETFLINILFISACCSFITIFLVATARLFKKRYTVRIRQILWIVLACRMAIPFAIGETWFSLSPRNTSFMGTHSQQRTYTLNNHGIPRLPDETQLLMVSKTAAGNPSTIGIPYTQDDNSSQGIADARTPSAGAENLHKAEDKRADAFDNHTSSPDTSAAYEVSTTDHPLIYACLQGIEFVNTHQSGLLTIYILGILAFTARHLIGLWLFNKKASRDMTPIQDNGLEALVSSIAAEIGLKKIPKLYLCPYAASPMVIHALCPVILLPRQEFDNQQLRLALTHELYHIKHRDLSIKMLYFLANALHWFNPFAYLMVHEAEKDMELYCDSCVVASYPKYKRKEYNALLLHILENQSLPQKQGYFSTCFHGGVKEVKERFSHNMDKRSKKKGVFPAVVVIATMLTASLLFSMQSSPNYAKDSSSSGSFDDKDSKETGSVNTSNALELYLMYTNRDNAQSFSDYRPTLVNASVLSLSQFLSLSSENTRDNSTNIDPPQTEAFSIGDPNIYADPEKVSDDLYWVPIYLEDYSGNVNRIWKELHCKRKPMQEIPMPEIFADNTHIRDYGVAVIEWSGDATNIQQNPDFFETQTAKGDANPLLYVGSWQEQPSSFLRMYFPQGMEPDFAYVEDLVLNEDGTPRYENYPDKIVFRNASIDPGMSMLSTSIAEHSSIDLYEDYITVNELIHPFNRGYRITCYWGTIEGLQSCTYYVVLRTQTTAYDDSAKNIAQYLEQ